MTRGKHAASANKRRAESAEEQLDRLIPQLTDAKRTAARYKSEAEQTPILRRQVTELRNTVGMPKAEHVRLVAELEQRHEDATDTSTTALLAIINKLVEVGALRHPTHDNWINGILLGNLRDIPRDLATAILQALGLERELVRSMLEGGMAAKAKAETYKEALNFQRLAAEVHGRTDRKIPMSLMDGVKINDVLYPEPESE
jgi:hypothetical protein